jgi:hypothetical protein
MGFLSADAIAEAISEENPYGYRIPATNYREQETGKILYPEVLHFLMSKGVNPWYLLTGEGPRYLEETVQKKIKGISGETEVSESSRILLEALEEIRSPPNQH